MQGRHCWRWRPYLLGIGLVALLVASVTACGRPPASTAVTSLFSADALYVEVTQHGGTQYQDPTVYTRTIRDETTITQVRQAIASVKVVPPNAIFNCPIGLMQYYVYTLKFYQTARLVEVVTIDATDCEFIQVKDAGTGATLDRCCPGLDFWTWLQQATGAPLPDE